MDETKEIAKFILMLTRNAQAPTDDTTQGNIMAGKHWLQQIISGELVVGKPIPAAIVPPAKPPKEKKK